MLSILGMNGTTKNFVQLKCLEEVGYFKPVAPRRNVLKLNIFFFNQWYEKFPIIPLDI